MFILDNKDLQKKRMITYFVEATCKIIDTEGIDAVTVRKVASLAGYNSATLYNYFDNLTHLIFFASLRHLKNYANDLPRYLKDLTDPLQIYLNVWRCFCTHSYRHPHFYQMIFFGGFDSKMVNDSITTYYSIFTEEINNDVKEFIPMFVEENIHKRDYLALTQAAKENIISDQDIRSINEMNVLIYRGMLDKMLNNLDHTTVESAVATTLKYIKRTLTSYGIPEDRLKNI